MMITGIQPGHILSITVTTAIYPDPDLASVLVLVFTVLGWSPGSYIYKVYSYP